MQENFDKKTINLMRGWLSDCAWVDVDASDIAGMPAKTILDGIRRFYSGGVAAFLLAEGL